MKTSSYLTFTTREKPAYTDIISNQLMIRAGMVRKLSSGIFTWLPLGLRVLRKIESIVREELNNAGAVEILMPMIQPAKLWLKSGRWKLYGAQLLKIKDRNSQEFCLGPTHEEVITNLVKNEIHSYKQLPIIMYQIQTKFRDEIRPRFGLLRSREFLMKDAYSFHIDEQSMAKTYDLMYSIYCKIFTRLGLKFCPVLADTGNIGGSKSHEYQALAESGEDLIVYTDSGNYAANIEMATSQSPVLNIKKSNKKIEKLQTPNIKTTDEVAIFLKKEKKQILKTLILKGKNSKFVALILRGDHTLNETKISKLTEIATPTTFVTSSEFQNFFGFNSGFVGPVGLDIPVIVDRDALLVCDFVCGANEEDTHLINVNWERDLPIPKIADLRTVTEEDFTPDGKEKIKITKGIEVGQLFQLGKKYSSSFNATVLNKQGKKVEIFMGCYGIGISRTMAAIIEQYHDSHGITWRDNVAPFQIAIIPIDLYKFFIVKELVHQIYHSLTNSGFEVILDDRKERVGVIFKDMDLIGIPHQIVVSANGIANKMVEYKSRTTMKKENVKIDNLLSFIKERVNIV